MPSLRKTALSLTSLLALSSCATTGQDVKPPVCPKPQPVAGSLMLEPAYVPRVQAELFKPSPSAKPK